MSTTYSRYFSALSDYNAGDPIDDRDLDGEFDAMTTALNRKVLCSGSAPSTPINGQTWVDTTNGIVYFYDNSTWVPVGQARQLTNRSGGAVTTGAVVIVDTSNASSFDTTTTQVHPAVAGVTLESSIADDAAGYVALPGSIATVQVTGSTSIGDYLATSTTAGKADPFGTAIPGAFAIALTSGSSTVTALILGTSLSEGRPNFYVHKNGSNQGSVATATITEVTWGTEGFDNGTYFASNAWTPLVPGKWLIAAKIEFTDAADGSILQCLIEKNGTSQFEGMCRAAGTGSQGVMVVAVVEANGTDDDFSISCYHEKGSDATVNGGTENSWFMGFYLGR